MRKRVIFVGSFKDSVKKGGGVGGQMFASKSLVSAKSLSEIEFLKIDSTAISIPAPPIYKRLPNVIARVAKFIYYLIFSKVEACLIFSSAGFSFIEKGLLALIARLFKVKVIFAPRSGLIIDSVNDSTMMRKFVSLIIRNSNHIICQGNSWKFFYRELSKEPDEKFVVIQNWINIDQYLTEPSYKNINNSKSFKILYLGWLEPYKGVFDLLESALLMKDKMDFELKIYGSGSAKDKLDKIIATNNLKDVVTLEGWADFETKINAFQWADVFVLPSHREGFPNVILEAMASELPVIATNVGAIGELIENEYNGILIEAKQPIELTEAIYMLAKKPGTRQKIATNARVSVVNNNNVEIASKQLKLLF